MIHQCMKTCDHGLEYRLWELYQAPMDRVYEKVVNFPPF